jgi:protein-S-isoprenylcysteine O-methyltransferase Ste14
MLTRNDPELLQERMASPIQRNQPLRDNAILPLLVLLFVAWLTPMPLDAVRFGWQDVPVWLQVLGALGVVLSFYGIYLVYRERTASPARSVPSREKILSTATLIDYRRA